MIENAAAKTVTISASRHAELLEAERFLRRLESLGVDNWRGYSYAFSDEDDE